MIRASIVIPTYNRVQILPICLQALSELDTDPETFEIIIVDNNSTDNTRDAVNELVLQYPKLYIRYLVETKQGASHARNRGIIEADGEIVCFLDDDSPPEPDWLNNLLGGFSDPSVGCAGGPSVLDFNHQAIPAWLQGDLQGLLSGYGLPYAMPTRVSRWDQMPLSCNMAIKRSLFADLGPFRTDLDRSGKQVLAAGDTEMAFRIHHAGWKVMYVHDARVRHIVAPERLTKAHIYRIGRGLAESHIILTYDRGLFLTLRWFASDLWYSTRMFFWLVVALLRRKKLWFDDYMRFWMVAMRIPLRVRALFKGLVSSSVN